MYSYKYNNKSKGQARFLRNNMTAAEKVLWNHYLKKSKFRYLRQKPIEGFIADFYCAKLKLVIELDGITHEFSTSKKRDKKRTDRFNKYDIKVIRFKNEEVFNKLNGVVGEIKRIEEEENGRVAHSPQVKDSSSGRPSLFQKEG